MCPACPPRVPAQGAAVVLGTLADSHVAYQMHLSARLALEHPELAEDLVMQMLSRQLDNESGAGAGRCRRGGWTLLGR